MKKLVVLSGAGISAESGIRTFRDSNGLWEGHDVMVVASPQGWSVNPKLVLEFYNQRRRQLFKVSPNFAHEAIVQLESNYEVVVITQNVDDLHERAGSKNVIHLHGQLRSVRSEVDEELKYYWEDDLNLGDVAEDGEQLRPDIVWFGERVPLIDDAISEISNADIVLIIGTSLQVYPAAELYKFAPPNAEIYYLDPKSKYKILPTGIKCIHSTAIDGMKYLLPKLLENSQ